MPLAIRMCLPALSNNLVNLVKTTNLAYAIAVPELMYMAKQIWGDSPNVREMMFTVLFAYAAAWCSLWWRLKRLERQPAVPGFGQKGGLSMLRDQMRHEAISSPSPRSTGRGSG